MSIKKLTEFAAKQANQYRGGLPVRTIGNTPATQAQPEPEVPTTYNQDGTIRTLGNTAATQQPAEPVGPQFAPVDVQPGVQVRNPTVPAYAGPVSFAKNLFGIGGQSPESLGATQRNLRLSPDPYAYIGDDKVRDASAGGGSLSMGRVQRTPEQQAAQDAQLGKMREQSGIRNQKARDAARLEERKAKARARQQVKDVEEINTGIRRNTVEENLEGGGPMTFSMQEEALPGYTRRNPAAAAAARRAADMAQAGGDPAKAQDADMFNMEEDDSFFQNQLADYRNRTGAPIDPSRYSLPAAPAPRRATPAAPAAPAAQPAAPASPVSQLEKDMVAGKLPWQQAQAARAAEYKRRTAATPQRPGVDNSRTYRDNRFNQMRKTQAPGRSAIGEKNLAAGDAARAAAKAKSNRDFLAGGNAQSTGANSSKGTSSLGTSYTRSVDPVTGRRSVKSAPMVGSRAQAAGITAENYNTPAGRARANVLASNSRARRNANPAFAAYRQRMKNRRRSTIRR